MMRTIYLLQQHYYNETDVIGAFRSLKRAEKAMKELDLQGSEMHADIIEIELED